MPTNQTDLSNLTYEELASLLQEVERKIKDNHNCKYHLSISKAKILHLQDKESTLPYTFLQNFLNDNPFSSELEHEIVWETLNCFGVIALDLQSKIDYANAVKFLRQKLKEFSDLLAQNDERRIPDPLLKAKRLFFSQEVFANFLKHIMLGAQVYLYMAKISPEDRLIAIDKMGYGTSSTQQLNFFHAVIHGFRIDSSAESGCLNISNYLRAIQEAPIAVPSELDKQILAQIVYQLGTSLLDYHAILQRDVDIFMEMKRDPHTADRYINFLQGYIPKDINENNIDESAIKYLEMARRLDPSVHKQSFNQLADKMLNIHNGYNAHTKFIDGFIYFIDQMHGNASRCFDEAIACAQEPEYHATKMLATCFNTLIPLLPTAANLYDMITRIDSLMASQPVENPEYYGYRLIRQILLDLNGVKIPHSSDLYQRRQWIEHKTTLAAHLKIAIENFEKKQFDQSIQSLGPLSYELKYSKPLEQRNMVIKQINVLINLADFYKLIIPHCNESTNVEAIIQYIDHAVKKPPHRPANVMARDRFFKRALPTLRSDPQLNDHHSCCTIS